MFISGLAKPSRTWTLASLPSWRMRRCSARPLPRASPSGLRCEVMRKLRPERMRSATARMPSSGLFVVVAFVVWLIVGFVRVVMIGFVEGLVRRRLVFAQQRLDAVGAEGRLVEAEVELRRVAQTNPLSEKMPRPPLPLDHRADARQRILVIHTAYQD